MPGIGISLGVGVGGGGGGTISPGSISVAAAATGTVAMLRSGLRGTVTWSKLSGASTLAIAASTGALSLSSGLASGNSVSAVFRAANTSGDAVERQITVLAPSTPAPTPSALTFMGNPLTFMGAALSFGA